ncbi:MAG TPA: hypothetical protein VK465_12550, partial [Fibrobacteria bacterium]|nr:hypothetical protein [Fibrobacteria bacterium]
GGGVVYVVNKDGYSRWDGHSWNSFPGGGIAVDVDPSGNPWIINAGGYPLQYQNGDLVLLYVSGRKARDISITADGSVYIVSSEPAWGSFQIMKWTGNGWTDVIGAARRIAGGSADNPWAADVGGEIWQR